MIPAAGPGHWNDPDMVTWHYYATCFEERQFFIALSDCSRSPIFLIFQVLWVTGGHLGLKSHLGPAPTA